MESDQNEPPPQNDAPEVTEAPTVVRVPRQRDRDRNSSPAEPDMFETVQGSKPGSRFLRLPRQAEQKLRRVGEGAFEATPVALRPATKMGRILTDIRHVLLGQPLATSALSEQRLSKVKALAIFSSDNLSSSAYATEEILLVLLLAGTASLKNAIPIALAIAALAAIVVTSYRQTIRAYPNGGGAYVVAKENLGRAPSMIAGSALFVDYVLTVAVSTAAGVAAITSAAPSLHQFRVEMAVGFVILLTMGNLRGIRESGSIFAIPTYFFVFMFGGMLTFGVARIAFGAHLTAAHPDDAIVAGAQSLTIFLFLRAFASGCAALTGIEAIANGVPYFKAPEPKNANTTLVWMAAILVAFFLGTTLLAHQMNIVPSASTTVVAQIAQTVFGHSSPFFYMVQVATAMILVLAANTSFAGLPAAASAMARDGVMPNQFAFRGERLAFSYGIIVVGALSSVLLVAFSADTSKLIPLYAIGVFTAFTLSQAGMVVHWRRVRSPGWRGAAAVNTLGAIATGVVAMIITATKFTEGAWLSMAIMVILVLLLWRISDHYTSAKEQLAAGITDVGDLAAQFYGVAAGRRQTVIVPVEGINRAVLRTLAFARTMTPHPVAVHVTDERVAAESFRRLWEQEVPDVPLAIVESPYRSLVEPFLAYVEGVDRTQPDQMVVVVLPEFVVKHFWQKYLHNQLSVRLKNSLMKRPNTVIVEVPYHFRQ